jgi:hypothetical protein
VTSAHLFVVHFIHDLTSRIDIGLGANALVSGDGGGVQYAIGPEIGFTLTDNLRAGLGYNFSGFSDEDLTQEQYTSHGFYLAMRLKFDEQLFNPHRRQATTGEEK